ncbi:hypothetical protein GGR44_002696 [Sphingobium fontiphilum]|uniref:Uncharacterized protein n=1 Tax=Sphingobium fontiphilum TaxID=944425 RepID=A0A7W6DGS9_9SPHN|nr:hypothetical protein [Sphingobium fontiphilum]MBB3983016.1 hypothetical protein [Sphingobium fontiphilum]
MTSIVLVLILLALVPATLSCVIWRLSKQLFRPARIMFASFAGMIVPTTIGYMIFQSEGGHGDPDPEAFMWFAMAVAAAVTFAIILWLETRQFSK